MHQRTARYAEKWQKKKSELEQERENKLAEELTFKPKINSSKQSKEQALLKKLIQLKKMNNEDDIGYTIIEGRNS